MIVIGSNEALRDLFPGSSSYASTIYVPFRSCIIVGPNGHDVFDILAHQRNCTLRYISAWDTGSDSLKFQLGLTKAWR